MKILFKIVLLLGLVCTGVTPAAQTIPVPKPNPNASGSNAEEKPSKVETRVYQSACPAVLEGLAEVTLLPPISDNQCGERSPLEVKSISGIKLSSPAVLNCRMTTTLAKWIEDANTEARLIMGAEISGIVSSTSYQCRRRNNKPEGKISEHGFANALDISGFSLANGKQIMLIADWPVGEAKAAEEPDTTGNTAPSQELRFLKAVHSRACEHFMTVLGPESDPYHTDHFHLDLGCHGKTCSYRICE